ncbi:MAG: hypothetical protein RR844_07255 [Clostridium sp.]
MRGILKDKTSDEIVDIFMECYKNVPEMKEYLSVKYAKEDSIDEIIRDCKERIYDMVICKKCGEEFIR